VRRKVLINTGLTAVSLILAVITAEIAIRFIPLDLIGMNWPAGYHISYLDGQSYRLAKNYPATFITNAYGGQNLIMSNSLGVRDVELPASDDEQIVLVLGDSMTFGAAVKEVNETWPRRLDEQIAQIRPGPEKYHVVNAGVSGYNTFQEVWLFQTLIKDMEQQGSKPKVALLSFMSGIWQRNFYGTEGLFSVLNDVIMYTSLKRAILNLPQRLIDQSGFDDLKFIGPSRINSFHQYLLTKSRLYFVLSVLLALRQGVSETDLSKVDPVAMNYEALKSFKEVAAAHDIQPVVAYLPGYDLFALDHQDENQKLVADLSTLCQRLDLTFINPYANMQQMGVNGDNAKEKLTLVYDSHYSPAGNLLYAQTLAPLLADYLARLQTSSPVH